MYYYKLLAILGFMIPTPGCGLYSYFKCSLQFKKAKKEQYLNCE